MTRRGSAEIALVANPTAGKGRAARVLDEVVARLRAGGLTTRTLVGTDAQDSLDLARKAVAEGVDALVSLGGDGMTHLALNVVAGTDTPLGVIPAGTGNDLANTLGLPVRDPIGAADVVIDRILDGGSWAMDAVRSGDEWWGCVLG
ncbi:MAG TPA: diacylglycerol kinase family protein, partial [Mycobacteriales bacterium]|nr:diacylglycerol kinase family protein [Mycobacteriales bacterium]